MRGLPPDWMCCTTGTCDRLRWAGRRTLWAQAGSRRPPAPLPAARPGSSRRPRWRQMASASWRHCTTGCPRSRCAHQPAAGEASMTCLVTACLPPVRGVQRWQQRSRCVSWAPAPAQRCPASSRVPPVRLASAATCSWATAGLSQKSASPPEWPTVRHAAGCQDEGAAGAAAQQGQPGRHAGGHHAAGERPARRQHQVRLPPRGPGICGRPVRHAPGASWLPHSAGAISPRLIAHMRPLLPGSRSAWPASRLRRGETPSLDRPPPAGVLHLQSASGRPRCAGQVADRGGAGGGAPARAGRRSLCLRSSSPGLRPPCAAQHCTSAWG